MTTTNEHTERAELKPCPFCGAGSTEIVENGKMWTGMKYSEPTSVSVRHHCEPIKGQPSRMLERVGKDLSSAIVAWNTRATLLEAQPMKLLTADEIWRFWWSRPEVPDGGDDSMEAEFVAAVRRVLAAHGIKEQP